jgi:glycerate-2-kinase
MGRAIARLLAGARLGGVLITSDPSPVPPFEVVGGSHPIPDPASIAAGRIVLRVANEVGPDDLAVVLISGGGSALLAAPASGLDIDDLQQTNALLLRSGASIDELNTVRKHLSAVKGGRLGEALARAGALVTLVISDVVGNPLDGIASGPTVPDPTTFEDALEVLDRYEVRRRVPLTIVRHLTAGTEGRIADVAENLPIFDRQVIEVVADGRLATLAAASAVEDLGLAPVVVTTELQGEARDVARRLIRDSSELAHESVGIYAGETTVTVTGEGSGGRNQELALAASIELAGRDDLILLALDTDGIDGTGGVAGAFADGTAVERGRSHGLEATEFLKRNDAHPFLDAIGDTVITGPTGTNVGDLVLLYRDSSG